MPSNFNVSFFSPPPHVELCRTTLSRAEFATLDHDRKSWSKSYILHFICRSSSAILMQRVFYSPFTMSYIASTSIREAGVAGSNPVSPTNFFPVPSIPGTGQLEAPEETPEPFCVSALPSWNARGLTSSTI